LHEYFLVVECKRVNPRLSSWAFVQAPFVRAGGHDHFMVEHVNCGLSGEFWRVGMQGAPAPKQSFHVGLVLKDRVAKGDGASSGSGREAIEEACHQACAGVAGLCRLWAELFRSGWQSHPTFRRHHKVVIPVVLTTAHLYEAQVDPSSASLKSGKLVDAEFEVRRIPWLLFQHHVSRSLVDRALFPAAPDSLSCILAEQSIRTVPIVSSDSIAAFLHGHPPRQSVVRRDRV
jgi:hypothetical protein